MVIVKFIEIFYKIFIIINIKSVINTFYTNTNRTKLNFLYSNILDYKLIDI